MYSGDSRSAGKKNNNHSNNYKSSLKLSSRLDRTDFVTIFHEHDIRQPFDPKNRTTETPGI
jgi:hypothetical protein